MNYTPDARSYDLGENQRRRLSLESINLRRSSSDDYNFDGHETEILDCGTSGERRMNFEEHHRHPSDEGGFAAIELLRPPSASIDDPNAHSEDASSIDERSGDDSAQPTSSRSGGHGDGVDLSFMSLEDLLYRLQREIVSSVSRSESANRFLQSNSEHHRKFVWSEHARNLFENVILKLKSAHQSEINNGYASIDQSDFLDILNRVVLPLWPHGWMSSNELNQVINRFSSSMLMPNRMNEDDNIDDHDHNNRSATMGHFAMGQNFGTDSLMNSLYSSVLNDNGVGGGSMSISTETSRMIGNQSMGHQGNNGSSMCFICDRSFQSAHLLKIHISHMHTPKALVCPHCQSRHSTLNGLRFHFSTKHKGLSQRFLSELIQPPPPPTVISTATTHSNIQSLATATAYVGSAISNFENSSISKLNSIRGQLPQISNSSQNGSSSICNSGESGEVECSWCKNKFGSLGSLKAHVSMMHTEKNVRCRYCPNFYATQRAMLQHTYLKHHKERNCQCPQCGETFRTSGLANLHRRYAHTCDTTTSNSKSNFSSNSEIGDSPNLQYLNSNSNSHISNLTNLAQQHRSRSSETMQKKKRGGGGIIPEVGLAATILTNQSTNRVKGSGKYHCRDCGAGFPMPSAVWAHRKKEHSESTSIKKRGVFSMSDPERRVGGQIFGYEQMRPSSKDGGLTAAGKKKMRVKCSVCGAIFSNGYACYLHKKKIHGEESIRRELNLSEKSTTATTTNAASTSSPKIAPIPMETAPIPISITEIATVSQAPIVATISEKMIGQARISTSSSSSRDSSPFYHHHRAGDVLLTEGVVRKRYEFHCQCGSTFYNGFAFSRHRQRTGCSDGVRGVVVKESLCGVCSEAFPTNELLNEHFAAAHSSTNALANLVDAIPKYYPTRTSSTSVSTSTFVEENRNEQSISSVIKDRSESNSNLKRKESSISASTQDRNESTTPAKEIPNSETISTSKTVQQRMGGATATAYVKETATKSRSDTTPSTSTSTFFQQPKDESTTPKISISNVQSISAGSSTTTSSISLRNFPIRCQLCPYETLSIDALKDHVDRHEKKKKNGATKSDRSSCPYCTYVTDNVSNYVRHASIHFLHKNSNIQATSSKMSDEQKRKKPGFDCTYCGRRFANTTELMEHEFMHASG